MSKKDVAVAIVEDSPIDMENCLRLLERYGQDKEINFSCSTYSTGDDFLMHFKAQFDFIILDINLASRNGIDVAHKIREQDEDVVIMFATNLAKYATAGYEVEAIDFALKPLQYPSFSLKLERVMKRLSKASDDDLIIKEGSGVTKIRISEIIYLEVYVHDVVFHMGDKEVKTRGSLKQYEEALEKHHFLRCNSCYLVSAAKIRNVNKYEIEMVDGTTLTISHPRKKAFMAEFRKYLAKEGA